MALAIAAPAVPQAASPPRMESDLPRGALLGFRVAEADGALVVRRLDPASPAARAGLRDGDRIEAVLGRAVAAPHVGEDLLRRLDGGSPAELRLNRAGTAVTVRFTPEPRPLEALAGVEQVYGVLGTPDGARLRTLLTRPAGAAAPLPAVFVTQWVSCDSIEIHDTSGTSTLLRALAERSGMATIRVERSTGGDSEGPGCHELDYDTEVAHYRHALAELSRHPWIDPARLVVLGLSLGSTTAPLVAEGYPVAGVVVTGAGAATYYERMLAFDRLAFERQGDPRELHARLLAHARFHQAYLLDGEDPRAIAERRPDLAGVWAAMRGTGDGVHYGRPYDWHRQAARRDFLSAWASLRAPVLVLYAEYDQFEPAAGHRLIVETRNRLQPGSAQYVELPRMGHDFAVYPTPEDAMRWRRGAPAAELVVEPILAWLRAQGLATAAAEGGGPRGPPHDGPARHSAGRARTRRRRRRSRGAALPGGPRRPAGCPARAARRRAARGVPRALRLRLATRPGAGGGGARREGDDPERRGLPALPGAGGLARLPPRRSAGGEDRLRGARRGRGRQPGHRPRRAAGGHGDPRR